MRTGYYKVTIAKKPLPDNFTVVKPEKIAVTNDAVTCTIYANEFAQGNVAYCEINLLRMYNFFCEIY
jgi:hypothetical protein